MSHAKRSHQVQKRNQKHSIPEGKSGAAERDGTAVHRQQSELIPSRELETQFVVRTSGESNQK